MSLNTYLMMRGSTYYFRRRVPGDIAEAFGKTEILISLRTKDPREAKARSALKIIETDQEFEEARNQISDNTPKPTSQSPSIQSCPSPRDHYDNVLLKNNAYRERIYSQVENDLPGFLKGDFITLPRNEWFNHLNEEGDWEKTLSYCFRFEIKERLAALKLARNVGNYKKYKDLANNDREVGLGLLDAEIKALKYILSQHKGNDPDHISAEASVTSAIPVISVIQATTAELLSIASQEWFNEKRKAVTEKTAEGNQARIREFISIIGDKPINQYTKADVREFKAVLEKLPPNWSKQKALKGLTARKVALQATRDTKTLSVTTINDILVICSRCFKWFLTNRDDIEVNPFEGIKVERKRDVRNERSSFSINDLNQIFASSRFADFDRNSAMYWVPIIGLFTGMRLGEICQLYTSDVKSDENGISYFDNNTDKSDKKLKSNAAKRNIPVHRLLIDLGFLDLVKQQTDENGDARIFPEIRVGADGHYSSRFGQKFSRFLTHIEVKREKISFHSFRHNFEDAARAAGIPHPVMSALQGHVMGDMSDRYGSGGYPLKVLNEALQKIEYPEINVDLLK